MTLLADRNARLAGAERCRRELRPRWAVIHAGEIHYDGKGYFGEGAPTSPSGCSTRPALSTACAKWRRR